MPSAPKRRPMTPAERAALDGRVLALLGIEPGTVDGHDRARLRASTWAESTVDQKHLT